MYLFPLKTRRGDEGISSRTGVDVGEFDCCSVASICDRRIDLGALEVSSADLSGISSSNSGEASDSFSFVTSKEDCREPLIHQARAEVSWGQSAGSMRGLERPEGSSVSKEAELKEPEGENTETEETDEFADEEGNHEEEGDTESMPVDETRDADEGRDGEGASEDDNAKGKAESRWFEV